MDKTNIINATTSLQAMERLLLNSRKYPDSPIFCKVRDNTQTALTQLREIKALLEGSENDFVPLDINKKPLMELKQLLLMHVPTSITSHVRQRFASLIEQALGDCCKKILAGVVLTCPWYAATQKERGEQAKHNLLLVIVMNHDNQFFSPANFQLKEERSGIDLGWLSVIELFHFGHFLVKGRTRCVEAAFCDEVALVYSSDEWKTLHKQLPVNTVTGLHPFLEACCGQAMGKVGKKRKNGVLKLKENASIAEICEAFRLLNHVHNHHQDLQPVSTELNSLSEHPEAARVALDKLKALYKVLNVKAEVTAGEKHIRQTNGLCTHQYGMTQYSEQFQPEPFSKNKQDPDMSKEDIFMCLCSWYDELRSEMKHCKTSDQKVVAYHVGEWMMTTRLQGRCLEPFRVIEDSHSHLHQLMQEIGGPLAHLVPDQVLLVARAGSHLYGLSTPESDADYVVVYRENTQSVLSACSQLSECFESRGPEKKVEYGVYEARLLCEMLLKCSVVILELVFSGDHEYIHPLWQQLNDGKAKFVTELAILKYLGMIRNCFAKLHSGKHLDTARERKLFYQIFHKMDGISHLMKGEAPLVRVTGPVRDFIMDIRTKELQNQLSRANLLDRAMSEYENLQHQLASREERLCENPDYNFITDWLLAVRGKSFT